MNVHLIQILLPLYDNDGRALPREAFARVRTELTEHYGGLTAFTRAPAEGLWRNEGTETSRDQIVIFEVMAPELEETWWRDYRRALESRFRQDVVVIRVQSIRLL